MAAESTFAVSLFLLASVAVLDDAVGIMTSFGMAQKQNKPIEFEIKWLWSVCKTYKSSFYWHKYHQTK